MANGQRASDPEKEQIGRIYSELDTVRQQQAKQDETLNHLAKGMDRLANGFDQMRQEWARHSQTDWKTLASWATVMLGILGLAMALVVSPLNERIKQTREKARRNTTEMRDNQAEQARINERARWLEKLQDRRHDSDELRELREMRRLLEKIRDDLHQGAD